MSDDITRRVITELLKRSDAERVAQTLTSAAQGTGARVTVSVDTSGKMLNVFVRLVNGDPDQVEPALVDTAKRQQWSLLSRTERRGTVWWFEPEPELKGPVSKARLPKTLWHVTPAANVESILTNGMVPRTRTFAKTSRRYGPRIYLATDVAAAKATINRNEDWVVLRINVDALPKDVRFYVDQEFGHRKDGTPLAVYTMESIPPAAVSVD